MVELRDGLRIEVDNSFETLADAATGEPRNGVYLVARTYDGGRVLDLDRHFDRMERSADELGVTLHVPRRRLRSELQTMVETLRDAEEGVADGRFRVTAVLDTPPWYLLSLERAKEVPPDLIAEGAECALARGVARDRARVKSTSWLLSRRTLSSREAVSHPDAADPPYEYLLTDAHGRILEGASSNFYAVVDDTLYTAADGVLEGIARRIVLQVASAMEPALAVRMEPVEESHLADRSVAEAFLSSSTRGVVPIQTIGSYRLGRPGVWTRRIAHAYLAELHRRLEPLVP